MHSIASRLEDLLLQRRGLVERLQIVNDTRTASSAVLEIVTQINLLNERIIATARYSEQEKQFGQL